jgi:hypothetical protein
VYQHGQKKYDDRVTVAAVGRLGQEEKEERENRATFASLGQ